MGKDMLAMQTTRRDFLEGLSAAFALAATSGCATLRPGSVLRIGLQLYSIRDYIASAGLERALAGKL